MNSLIGPGSSTTSSFLSGEACSEDFPGYLHGAVQRYFLDNILFFLFFVT